MYHDANTHYLYNAIPDGEGIYTLAINDNTGPCLVQVRFERGLRFWTGYIPATPGNNSGISGNLDNATYVPMSGRLCA